MRWAPALLCLTIALGAPSVGRGQPADAATRNAARALAEEGERLYDRGQYADAVDRFTRASSLIDAPTLHVWLARSLARMGKLIEAEEHYRLAGRAVLEADAPPAFRQAIDDAKRELAELRPRIPTLEISRDAGVGTVKLDGAAVPDPLIGVKRPVNPGEHVVEATGVAAQRVTVAEGQTASVTVRRAASPASTAASTAAPAVATPQRIAPALPPDRAASGQQTAGWIALALGGAGLGVGAVTGILATRKANQLDGDCPNAECPATSQGDIDSFGTLATVSTIGFIAGGVGAAVGIVLLITAKSAPKRRAAFLAPAPLSSAVKGSF